MKTWTRSSLMYGTLSLCMQPLAYVRKPYRLASSWTTLYHSFDNQM